jgi:F-type H+-transporting ATPase subunit b
VKNLVPWILFFSCALIFTFFVDLGGNFFGVPDSALNFLFAANLTLFLWLLARFVGRPMAGFMEARREGIAEELAQARQRVEEATSLRDEVQKRLDQIEVEVSQLRERAERDGAAEIAEIAEQTSRDEERFLRRVEEEIARREAEAREKLGKETAKLTAELTRELLSSEITDADRRRILDRSLSAMKSTPDKE